MEQVMTDESQKWFFMMRWCKAGGLPPADSCVWNLAEKAWEAMKNKQQQAQNTD